MMITSPPLIPIHTFSILERIDVGETMLFLSDAFLPLPFSILERIDVGETHLGLKLDNLFKFAFSILERIDVGET